MTMQDPSGKEREVKSFSGTAIDGAPITYIVVLAAVVAALAFIPFSVILAFGGSFPVSQGIWGLVGWLLGPIAGSVATGIGTIVGVVVAPLTAGIWPVRIYGAVLASFAGGLMFTRANRRDKWWIGVAVLAILSLGAYVGRAVLVNGVSLRVAILGSILDWSATLLFILPTRKIIARWIGSKNLSLLASGLFAGTWVTYGISHVCQSAILYFMLNYPEAVWVSLIPVIPVEMAFRCVIGAVIGTGVIAGMRAIGLVNAVEAIY